MCWIYPEVVMDLKRKCVCFLNKEIDALELQSSVYDAEHKIVALEEKWLRDFLFDMENRIDLVLHTTDDDKLELAIEVIAKHIMEKLS